jgi:hypothetical protein
MREGLKGIWRGIEKGRIGIGAISQVDGLDEAGRRASGKGDRERKQEGDSVAKVEGEHGGA